MPIDYAERKRRLRLMEAHVAAENAHDLDAIMATFAPDAEVYLNSRVTRGFDNIARHHAAFGASSEPGAFEDARGVNARIFYSATEIVVEARVHGIFVRPFGKFQPTHRPVVVHGFNSYLFNAEDKLVVERAVLNLGTLADARGAR